MQKEHWYKLNDRGQIFIGQYIGRQKGYVCCVCDKGCNAHMFNVFYNEDEYESWGFGNDHMPEIIDDLGTSDEIIIGE